MELGFDNTKLLVLSESGELIATESLPSRTVAITGGDDGDLSVPSLGESALYLRLTKPGQAVMFGQDVNGRSHSVDLHYGVPAHFGRHAWILIKSNEPAGLQSSRSGAVASGREPLPLDLLDQLSRWMAQPMDAGKLRAGLNDFLGMMMDGSGARNGLIVSKDENGFSLVGAQGLTTEDALKIWSRMPESIHEDILRTQAKVILPDNLRSKSASSETTVFIKDVRSLVGFPILAEGKLLAILCLGFQNVLRDLSQSLQSQLELSCNLAGLIFQRALLRQELDAIKVRDQDSEPFAMPTGRLILGSSPQIVRVYKLITRLAPVKVPIVVRGETGTGKELVARELHRLSDRRGKPFIVVNAAAIPESLFESELFGHSKGAFTGALSDRVGLIEQAHEGTLFIDEIGELPLAMQSKLLRALQEQAVTRVGESRSRPVDFRLITATHRDVEAMILDGEFREDLFYRIAGAQIHLPPLRDRGNDVIELANYFKQRFAKLHELPEKEWSSDALTALERGTWKGNVRQLENTVARSFVMAEGHVITRHDLGLSQQPLDDVAPDGDCVESLADAKNRWLKNYISSALERHGNNRVRTAKALGIGQRTLFRYIDQFNL